MKTLLLLLLLPASALADANVFCSGYSYPPSQFISGQCNRGNCTAYTYGSQQQVSGSCSDNIRFEASASFPGGSISGQCRNGNLQVYVPADYASWSGSCSNGAVFRGNSRGTPAVVSGSCQEDGGFNIYLPSSSLYVSGNCQSQD